MAGLYLLRGGELFVARNKQHYDSIIECNSIEDDADGWSEPEGAVTYTFLEGDGQLTFIIAFSDRHFTEPTSDELRSLVVHESVHVFQQIRKRMLRGCMADVDTLLATSGLGSEFEAYAVSNIYTNVMELFEKARDAYC